MTHPVCSDPACHEHGIAASNRRQSAFYATHDRTVPAGPDDLELQEELGEAMAADVHAAEAARWAEDDRAYDGSAWPMRRELTPRERDVLTRILDGWWHTLIDIDAERRGVRPRYVGAGPIAIGEATEPVDVGGFVLSTNPFVDDPRVAWMRMDVQECQMLLDLRAVLNPRQD